MPTSSITHNFVISGPENVRRFIEALDAADKDRVPVPPVPGRLLTDPEEIAAVMAKRKEHHV